MSAALSPATLDVIIYLADDRTHARELLEAVDVEAKNAGPTRVGDSTETRTAAQAYDDFVTEMAERAVTVTVQALPPRKWREICRKHPARKDNAGDEAWGFDTEAVADEVMASSVVAPQFADEKELNAFLDSLRNAELTEIEFAICQINDGDLGDPKGVRLTSVIDQISDASSKSPGRLA